MANETISFKKSTFMKVLAIIWLIWCLSQLTREINSFPRLFNGSLLDPSHWASSWNYWYYFLGLGGGLVSTIGSLMILFSKGKSYYRIGCILLIIYPILLLVSLIIDRVVNPEVFTTGW